MFKCRAHRRSSTAVADGAVDEACVTATGLVFNPKLEPKVQAQGTIPLSVACKQYRHGAKDKLPDQATTH